MEKKERVWEGGGKGKGGKRKVGSSGDGRRGMVKKNWNGWTKRLKEGGRDGGGKKNVKEGSTLQTVGMEY